MTDAELRLECLKLAKGSLGMAEVMMHFVKTGQRGYKVEATVHATCDPYDWKNWMMPAYKDAVLQESTEQFGFQVEATVHAAYNEAGPERSTEEFLAALKAGDEREAYCQPDSAAAYIAGYDDTGTEVSAEEFFRRMEAGDTMSIELKAGDERVETTRISGVRCRTSQKAGA